MIGIRVTQSLLRSVLNCRKIPIALIYCFGDGAVGGEMGGLMVSTSRHVEICVVQKITFAKTIQPVTIRRESQSAALLVRAEGSSESNRRSIDAAGDRRVGFGFPATGMPRTF